MKMTRLPASRYEPPVSLAEAYVRPAPTSGLTVAYDRLYAFGATVLDAVPTEMRNRHTLWRAAHVGKLALNVARGSTYLNAGIDPIMHFTPSYEDAQEYAAELLHGRRSTQFDDTDRLLLAHHSGRSAEAALPVMIFALHPELDRDALDIQDASLGEGDGVELAGFVPMGSIDAYSQAVLADIFPPKS